LHVISPSEPTDPSAARSLTPFELARLEALVTALLPGWDYDETEETDTMAVYVFIDGPRRDGGCVIEGDQRGGVSVSDPNSDVVVTNVSLEAAVVAIREAIGVPVG
jgi:hypothetical protein